jgi:hypothetical protein
MYKFRKISMTINDFITLHYGQIDCNPEHQRLPRKKNPVKAQRIIESLLNGVDIGQITIHKTPDGKFKYESIDGGHRKRYIYSFFQNKIKTLCGRNYRDLSKEEMDKFLNTELTFCIYENLTDQQVGEIFRALNDATPVNRQETRNSYGKSHIARVIRDLVRPVEGVGNSYHKLFEYTVNDNDDQNFSYVGFTNEGLRIDEMVARIAYRYYAGGGLGISGDQELDAMYNANLSSSASKKIHDQVTKCLDFVFKMTQIRRSKVKSNGKSTGGLGKKDFVLFSRIYLYLEEKYKEFRITDLEGLFTAIYDASRPYRLKYKEQPPELMVISPLDKGKSIGKQYQDSLNEYRPEASVRFAVECVMKNIDILDFVIPLDISRCFTHEMKLAKLIEQNYKCAVSGETITLDNSHGAHIVAWSNGGRTNYANLAMVASKYNSEMGTMSLSQYKNARFGKSIEKTATF